MGLDAVCCAAGIAYRSLELRMYLDDRESRSINQSINGITHVFNSQFALARSLSRRKGSLVVSCDVDQCRLTCISEANRHGGKPSLIGLDPQYCGFHDQCKDSV
jgi:hypothetical protein